MRRPQAKSKNNPIAESLLEMFPEDFIRTLAKETGFVKRERKIDPVLLFWVLILQFGVNFKRTIHGIKRCYESTAQVEMSISSFHDRFTPEMEEFLHRCVLHAIEFNTLKVNRRLREKLKDVTDLLIQDSTIIRLHDSLAKKWPAARSSKATAGMKLSCLMSAVSDGPKRVAIVPESTAEIKTLKLGPWVQDRVLLLDLGFFRLQIFDRIDQYKGLFVTRLKKKVNATIVSVNRTCRGNAKELVGEKLWDVLPSLKRGVLDLEVEMSFKRREYKGKRTKTARRFRVVGMYNDDAKGYHLYLTNIPVSRLSAEDVARLYGARWEIELIFKELKSQYRMDQVTSKNPNVIKCLTWVAILVMMCSRRILHRLRAIDPDKAQRYTHLRSARVFMENAHRILDGVLESMGLSYGFEEMMAIYGSQNRDPNTNRERMMDRWVE